MIRLTGGLARSCDRSTIDGKWMWLPAARQPSGADGVPASQPRGDRTQRPRIWECLSLASTRSEL